MLSPLLHHQSRLETQSLQQEEARSLEVEGPLATLHGTSVLPPRSADGSQGSRCHLPGAGQHRAATSALPVAGHQGPRQVHGQGRLGRAPAEVPPGAPTLLETAGGAFDPEKPRACHPGAAGAPTSTLPLLEVCAEEDPAERRTVWPAGARLPPTHSPDSSRSVCAHRSVCRCVCVAERPTPRGTFVLTCHIKLALGLLLSTSPVTLSQPCPPLFSVLGPEPWVRPLSPASVQHTDRLLPEMSSGFLSWRAAFGVQPLYLCQLTRNVPYCMGETAFSAVLGWGLHCCLSLSQEERTSGATAGRRGEQAWKD